MKKRMLVAYSMSSTFVQTTLDYLKALKTYSNFEVDYLHVTNNAQVSVDLSVYDAVFHNYCARLCIKDYVSKDYLAQMKRYKGVKIFAIQDEYDHTDFLKSVVQDVGFDIFLTCVPQDSLEYVYPQKEFPNTTFVTVFTGYVPDDFAQNAPKHIPLVDRPIFIGYRGRDIGGRYGRLGFDKYEIGRRMKEICDAKGIATDIAMDEASRIYGTAWFDFLGNCRAMLGSESGSNVFDFDGSIAQKYKEMTEANGGVAPSYAEFSPIVAKRDSEINMGQISPRVFECALMRTPMVLFKGRYSDAMQPDLHYISLQKDFSNVDAVIEQLNDLPVLEQMVERTYQHLVASGQFGYRAYVARLEGLITQKLHQKNYAAIKSHNQLVVNDGVEPLDVPTPEPLPFETFAFRNDVHLYEIYSVEADRLAGIVSEHIKFSSHELDRLAKVYYSFFESSQKQLPLPTRYADFESKKCEIQNFEKQRVVQTQIEKTRIAEIKKHFTSQDVLLSIKSMCQNQQDIVKKYNELLNEINVLYCQAVEDINAAIQSLCNPQSAISPSIIKVINIKLSLTLNNLRRYSVFGIKKLAYTLADKLSEKQILFIKKILGRN